MGSARGAHTRERESTARGRERARELQRADGGHTEDAPRSDEKSGYDWDEIGMRARRHVPEGLRVEGLGSRASAAARTRRVSLYCCTKSCLKSLVSVAGSRWHKLAT
jgi:hypothetical protein